VAVSEIDDWQERHMEEVGKSIYDAIKEPIEEYRQQWKAEFGCEPPPITLGNMVIHFEEKE
jgi:hypothetical protein